jgi:D-alanyl-D-alanine carboxypeptidase/D-alanyl-D-alanine-endopeptidase (penicillin-binding protein 4)
MTKRTLLSLLCCCAVVLVATLHAAGADGAANSPLTFANSAPTIPERIDAILSGVPGNQWSALVENDSGSVVCYERNPTNGLAPASNTKLFTTAAAFALLGTNYAFETRVYADGSLSNGVLAGNLNLVCEHDPTWNTSIFQDAREPLDHLAAQLKAQGLRSVSSNVQFYGACALNPGSSDSLAAWSPQDWNVEAATAFVATLREAGISVSGKAEGQEGFTAPGMLLCIHHSTDLTREGQPLSLGIACIPLLKVSHNVMADLLCRHLGWKLGGSDSYAAGTAQILRWLNDVPRISTNTIVMNDGSGLSRGNRFSARQCVALVRYQTAAYPTWATGLPIGCREGTIRRRFCGTDGEDQVHAKTGSLRTSVALSGYLINPYDQQRYLFSFIANRPSIEQPATRQAIDNAVVLFAAPRLLHPEVSMSDNVAVFTWPASAGQEYRIQFKESLSDVPWQTLGADITATGTTVSARDASMEAQSQRFYRVFPVN